MKYENNYESGLSRSGLVRSLQVEEEEPRLRVGVATSVSYQETHSLCSAAPRSELLQVCWPTARVNYLSSTGESKTLDK